MKFTYVSYQHVLSKLISEGYEFELYDQRNSYEKSVICRHDLDASLQKAIRFAEIEKELGITSVYFVLLSTNFYNVFSKESRDCLFQIENLGHKIGLHFDASIYKYDSIQNLEEYISTEKSILETLLKHEIKFVSFHRPVKELFNKTLNNGMISAYDYKFFSLYEYVSDSRRSWKKDPLKIIRSKKKHIQLLTHPLWYSDIEISEKDTINNLKNEIHNLIDISLVNNISDFEELIKGENKNEQ